MDLLFLPEVKLHTNAGPQLRASRFRDVKRFTCNRPHPPETTNSSFTFQPNSARHTPPSAPPRRTHEPIILHRRICDGSSGRAADHPRKTAPTAISDSAVFPINLIVRANLCPPVLLSTITRSARFTVLSMGDQERRPPPRAQPDEFTSPWRIPTTVLRPDHTPPSHHSSTSTPAVGTYARAIASAAFASR